MGCSGTEDALRRPNGVAVRPDGGIVVSDFLHSRLVVFDSDLAFERTIGREGSGRNQLFRVFGLSVGADDAVFVVNRVPRPEGARGQRREWQVKKFVKAREASVTVIGGEDAWFEGIAPGPDGSLFLGNAGEGTLTMLDADLAVATHLGPSGRPKTLTRSGDDLWVVYDNEHRVVRTTLTGRVTLDLGPDSTHGRDLWFPSSVAVCPAGWVAVADLGNHRVQRFAFDGTLLGGFAPADAGPTQPLQLLDIGVSPDCERLYLVDSKGNRVLVTTVDGEVIRELHAW